MQNVVIPYFENKVRNLFKFRTFIAKLKNNFDWELLIPEKNTHISCFGYQWMVGINQT